MKKDILIFVLIVVIFLIIALLILSDSNSKIEQVENPEENNVLGNMEDTSLKFKGEIMIEDIGKYEFNPKDIRTVRKDIFKEGRFSVFDILVYLDEKGDINMKYHLDEDVNTHVIDSINNKEDWWYMTYYDGGWPENNVFRMDHYPYKDKMYIRIEQYNPKQLQEIYDVFEEEIIRKNKNDKLIIPKVIIKAPNTDLEFENVEVTPHNLRNDVFQDGVITAIDVILSLGDKDKLNYDLQWYESIGSAGIVKSYWVERINEDKAHRRCGFVYEAGSNKYQGFRGNHIHLPSDTRVLNSPEYEEYFWICL